jgi:hypothetical protein
MDFIRIMAKYGACRRGDAEELLRTKAIRELMRDHMPMIDKLMANLENAV